MNIQLMINGELKEVKNLTAQELDKAIELLIEQETLRELEENRTTFNSNETL